MNREGFKLEDLRGKDSRELRMDVQTIRKELFEMRFKSASEEVSEPHRFKGLRKTIARIQTVLRQRELAAASSKEA